MNIKDIVGKVFQRSAPKMVDMGEEPEQGSLGLLFGGQGATVGNGLTISSVYRAVNAISDGIAIMDFNIIEKVGEYDKVAVDHVCNNILNSSPNQYMTRYDLMKTAVQSILLTGNAYIYINRNNRGVVDNLVWIPSEFVSVTLRDNMLGKYPEYQVTNIGKLDSDSLIHIKNITVNEIGRAHV